MNEWMDRLFNINLKCVLLLGNGQKAEKYEERERESPLSNIPGPIPINHRNQRKMS